MWMSLEGKDEISRLVKAGVSNAARDSDGLAVVWVESESMKVHWPPSRVQFWQMGRT